MADPFRAPLMRAAALAALDHQPAGAGAIPIGLGDGFLRGRGQALYTVLAYGLPGVVGALAGGALGDAAGLASVYWAAMAASVLSCLCAWKVGRCALKERSLE